LASTTTTNAGGIAGGNAGLRTGQSFETIRCLS
jgi:hypothetical protein